MKVLLISPSYHPVLGGLQTVAHQLALALLNHGDNVSVVTNRYPRSLPAQETVDGVPVHRWPFFDSFGQSMRHGRIDLALAGLFYNPAASARLSRLAATLRPDVVNLHFPEPRLASLLIARRRHPFRLVVSLHGDDIERWFRPSHRPAQLELVRQMLRSADAVTACSAYLLNRALALEPSISSKSAVIHNGVDTARFQNTEGHRHPRPYIFAYGRHTHKKGFDLLLHAFAPVAQRFPGLDLILAGAGDQTDELLKLRAALRLDHRVVFYGRANPQEVVRLLNGSRLVVVPSREEPFGIVAVEALLSGRPLVATRVGGLPEVAASAAGRAVIHWANPDASGLQRAVFNALSEPPPPAGRPSPSTAFSLSRMTRSYRNVLEGRAAAAEEPAPGLCAAVC